MKNIYTLHESADIKPISASLEKREYTVGYVESLKKRISKLENLVKIYTTRSKERFDHDLRQHTIRAATTKLHLLPEFLMRYNEEWFLTENETAFKAAVAKCVYEIATQRDRTLYSYILECVIEENSYGKALLASMLDEDDED